MLVSKTDRKVCAKCTTEKNISEFYTSFSPLDLQGKTKLCKKCIQDMVNVNDVNSFKNMLRSLDKPFVAHLYESALTKNAPIGEYFKLVNAKDFRYFTWENSVEELKYSKLPNEDPQSVINEQQIANSIIEKWGVGYTPLQYKQLEKFESDMIRDYTIETASHKDYLKKICKISLKMDVALDSDKISEFDKYSKQYDALMKSAKFTAVQRSASDDSGGLNTFSEFFRLIEEEGFIPVYPKEDRDIVDSTISYMEDYLKKIFTNDPQIASEIESMIGYNEDDTQEDDVENEEVIKAGEDDNFDCDIVVKNNG